MRAPTPTDWLRLTIAGTLACAGLAALPEAPHAQSRAQSGAQSDARPRAAQAAPPAAQAPAPPAPAAPASAPAAAGTPAAALTLDQVIARHVEARGGLAKLAAIQTLMVTGRLHMGNDPGQPITIRLRRPNQIRQDFIVQMRASTRAYDGVTGWERMPSNATDAPTVQVLAGRDLDDVRAEAENGIDGPLVNYRERGTRVELGGIESFADRQCYVLTIRLRTGHVMRQYLDAVTFLEVGKRLTRTVGDKPIAIEERVGDHRPVAGVLFPHFYESGPEADPHEMRMRVEKIVANPENPPIDEAIFRNPGAARP